MSENGAEGKKTGWVDLGTVWNGDGDQRKEYGYSPGSKDPKGGAKKHYDGSEGVPGFVPDGISPKPLGLRDEVDPKDPATHPSPVIVSKEIPSENK